MPLSALPTPEDRFARLIDGLCRVVAARGGRGGLAAPLICLIWSRLRRIAARFAGIAARCRAGRLRRRVVTSRPAARPGRPRGRRPLPQGVAWLVRLVPAAAAAGSQLQHLLADPDMAALLAAAPEAGRILRPLCRMLGVRPPPGPRPAPATTPPSPPALDPPAADPPALDPPAAAVPAGPPPPARPPPPPSLPRPRGCGPPLRA